MHTISFSHKYFKMPDGYEISTVLQVIPIESKDISDSFYDYDTTYPIDFNEVAKYPLPKGKLLIIFLKSKSGLLWTTIRSWSFEKEKYYKLLYNQRVNCIVRGKA